MSDLIDRQMAIDDLGEEPEVWEYDDEYGMGQRSEWCYIKKTIEKLPSAQPERLTDDDFETIRIHLNAYKEKLCNQHRWKEAEEYQRIIDRFMAFASAQPEQKKGRWIPVTNGRGGFECDECHNYAPSFQDGVEWLSDYCPNCGARMEGEANERYDLQTGCD